MGRYNFAAHRVHQHATQLLERSRIAVPPPWYSVIGSTPPPAILTRPPLQKPMKRGKKAASRIFQPLPIRYEEDRLRWEYFNDHPWELARPRVVLEDDGRDLEKWDWSLELDFALNRPLQWPEDDMHCRTPKPANGRTPEVWDTIWAAQNSRPINGESVVQRQRWLITNERLTEAAAYDTARKEYYRIKHYREVERRVAHEEALAVGASFGPGPLEIGMKLEDQQYENWKVWAMEQAQQLRQLSMQGSDSAGVDASGAEESSSPEQPPEEEEPDKAAEASLAPAKGERAEGSMTIP